MKVTIEKTIQGHACFIIPCEYIKKLKWKTGDTFKWIKNDDESWIIERITPNKKNQ